MLVKRPIYEYSNHKFNKLIQSCKKYLRWGLKLQFFLPPQKIYISNHAFAQVAVQTVEQVGCALQEYRLYVFFI